MIRSTLNLTYEIINIVVNLCVVWIQHTIVVHLKIKFVTN